MNITLNNKEFEEAVSCYLTKKGFDIGNYDVTVRMVQGRSGSGNRAEIELIEKEAVESTETAQISTNDSETANVPFDDSKAVESEAATCEPDKDDTPSIPSKKPEFGQLFGKGD